MQRSALLPQAPIWKGILRNRISVLRKNGVEANQFLLLARWWNGFALENDCLSLSSSVSTFHLLSNGNLKKKRRKTFKVFSSKHMYMDKPRWWDQYVKLPWPDEVATLLKAGLVNPVQGEDCRQNERVRRTVVRYLVLSYVLCLRRISSRVRNQCPDMESLLGSCLIRKDEVRLSARSSIFSICSGCFTWWWGTM